MFCVKQWCKNKRIFELCEYDSSINCKKIVCGHFSVNRWKFVYNVGLSDRREFTLALNVNPLRHASNALFLFSFYGFWWCYGLVCRMSRWRRPCFSLLHFSLSLLCYCNKFYNYMILSRITEREIVCSINRINY